MFDRPLDLHGTAAATPSARPGADPGRHGGPSRYIRPPYVALLERNQRPVTADMLLRLARTYKIDLADLAGEQVAPITRRGCSPC